MFVAPSKDRLVKDFLGLRIVAPNGLNLYCTVERAMNSRLGQKAKFDKDVFYDFVGLSRVVDPKHPHGDDCIVTTSQELSSELKAGSRCYAQFTNGWYYWGEVARVNGTGKQRTVDVQFDDGDFLAGLHSNCVETEEVALAGGATAPNFPGQSQVLGLLDLHAQRCKVCRLCIRMDCGQCHACRNNAESSQSCRLACVMKVRAFCLTSVRTPIKVL